MPSFQISVEPNRRAAAKFVGQVRRALQKALIEEQRANGTTQSDVARAIGVHRSVINRELKGFKDITLGRVAELAWAMKRKPNFDLEKIIASPHANYTAEPIVEPLVPSVSQGQNIEPQLRIQQNLKAFAA